MASHCAHAHTLTAWPQAAWAVRLGAVSGSSANSYRAGTPLTHHASPCMSPPRPPTMESCSISEFCWSVGENWVAWFSLELPSLLERLSGHLGLLPARGLCMSFIHFPVPSFLLPTGILYALCTLICSSMSYRYRLSVCRLPFHLLMGIWVTRTSSF